MPNNKLPNLIIAGVTKGGSTSVFSYLADHPEVCGAAKKEICYFMPLRYDKDLAGLEEYAKYFENCGGGKYRMEASPGYIYGGEKLARGMKEVLPDAKVMIILRNPIDRIISFFKSHQNKFAIDQSLDFHAYLERCKLWRNEESEYIYFQLFAGCYSDYLPAWQEVFDKNLKIMYFDDLKNNNTLFMQSICEWLNIDPGFYNDYNFVVENKTRYVKLKYLHKIAVRINQIFEKRLRKNVRLKNFIRNIYYSFNEKQSDTSSINNSEYKFLSDYYAEYNRKLKSILIQSGHTQLPDWIKE